MEARAEVHRADRAAVPGRRRLRARRPDPALQRGVVGGEGVGRERHGPPVDDAAPHALKEASVGRESRDERERDAEVHEERAHVGRRRTRLRQHVRGRRAHLLGLLPDRRRHLPARLAHLALRVRNEVREDEPPADVEDREEEQKEEPRHERVARADRMDGLREGRQPHESRRLPAARPVRHVRTSSVAKSRARTARGRRPARSRSAPRAGGRAGPPPGTAPARPRAPPSRRPAHPAGPAPGTTAIRTMSADGDRPLPTAPQTRLKCIATRPARTRHSRHPPQPP